ncbi:MAG: hypothetical protein QW328_07885 [Nitrososphaerota archaeon]
MNLETHVKVTVAVLEKWRESWSKYFTVENLHEIVKQIHAAVDVFVKDFNHHSGNVPQSRAFYHLMKARNIWLSVVEGKMDPESVEKDFFENLILAMHLYQDAVICPMDMREHDFMEKKIWEIIKNAELQVWDYSLLDARRWLKHTGLNEGPEHYVDPYAACDAMIGWTTVIAKAVFTERVISKAEAENFLVKNGVMRVKETRDPRLGDPVRKRIAENRAALEEKIKFYGILAFINLLVVGWIFISYPDPRWYYNLYRYLSPGVEIWAALFPLWIALAIGIWLAKPIILRRYDKKSVKDYQRAELLDYYPTHAFFDAPSVYLEYMECGKRENTKIKKAC